MLSRERRRLALLVVAASLLGLDGNLTATAQDAEAPVSGETLFGSYQIEARGLGVQGTYNIEGLLPGGSPVIDVGLPETLARFSTGPSGYGLASLAYPGGVLVNLDTLIAQTGGAEGSVPPYPIKSEAFFPSGPLTADGSQPGATVQKVVTGDLGVQVNASFPAVEAPPIVTVGSITSASRTSIEGEKAVSRTRVSLAGVNILGGVISIDSLVTDLVAAHDGTTGSTAGGTTATGVRFLGLDASLTEKGLVLAEAPPVEGPGSDLGVLGDLVGPLDDLAAPVRDLLSQVLGQAVPQLNDVLAQAGIELRILDPQVAAVESGAASRVSTGLSLSLSYEGKEQQALADLINSLPAELKPSLGPIPNPITFLAENHFVGLSLAPASVSSLASPPFPAIDVPLPSPVDPLPFDSGGSIDLGSPGFSTPIAPLPEPTGGTPPNPAEPASNDLAAAVPGILVALALLASPLFGLGSSRLADNVLAPVSTSCPIGLDKPQAPTRTT